MLFTTVLAAAITILLLFLNYKNKFIYILSAQQICLSVLLCICVIYMSKAVKYQYFIQADYELYLQLYKLKFNFNALTRLYNCCIVCFMIGSIMFSKLMIKLKWWHIAILLMPVAGFMWLADYTNVYDIYINYYTRSDWISRVFYNYGQKICEMIFLFYLFLPCITLIISFKKVKIFLKRRYNIVMTMCMMIVHLFVWFMFVKGLFSNIWITNVNVSKLPFSGEASDGYIVMSLLYIIMLFVIMLLITYFKPYSTVSSKDSGKTVEIAKLFNKNLSMIMHVYKNSVLSMGQQFMLMKINLESKNYEGALENSDIGNSIVGETMDMIEKLLSLLHGGREPFAYVDLIECIELAIGQLDRSVLIHRGYSTDDQLIVCGDKHHLGEMFKNLLLNACDASRAANRSCEITIKVINEGDFFMICIRDNGIGIEKSNLHKVFVPFYSTKPKSEMGGVGLSYVKNIVRIHSGDIRVKSNYGEYAEFQAAFPANKKKKMLHWGENI